MCPILSLVSVVIYVLFHVILLRFPVRLMIKDCSVIFLVIACLITAHCWQSQPYLNIGTSFWFLPRFTVCGSLLFPKETTTLPLEIRLNLMKRLNKENEKNNTHSTLLKVQKFSMLQFFGWHFRHAFFLWIGQTMMIWAQMRKICNLNLSCMVSTEVDRCLEAILNHLGCSSMSQPPSGEPPKWCLWFHLIIVCVDFLF